MELTELKEKIKRREPTCPHRLRLFVYVDAIVAKVYTGSLATEVGLTYVLVYFYVVAVVVVVMVRQGLLWYDKSYRCHCNRRYDSWKCHGHVSVIHF